MLIRTGGSTHCNPGLLANLLAGVEGLGQASSLSQVLDELAQIRVTRSKWLPR
jgi:hypothetical protein